MLIKSTVLGTDLEKMVLGTEMEKYNYQKTKFQNGKQK